jgi:cytoskeletal protein CcmA (bactofilin family)
MKTVIGGETRIAGPLFGKDDLEVHGTVEGPVHGEASVTIADGARIGGEVRGREVIVGGELVHPVFASVMVRLLTTARVTGDIEAPRLAIDEGAVFDGQIRMRKAAVSHPPSAVSPVVPAPAMPRERAIPELATPGRKALVRKTS